MKFRLSVLAVVLTVAVGAPRLSAQAVATATGNALAVGLAYQSVNPDYGPIRSSGLGIFANYDFSRYVGVTAEINFQTSFSHVVFLEKTYMVGARGEYTRADSCLMARSWSAVPARPRMATIPCSMPPQAIPWWLSEVALKFGARVTSPCAPSITSSRNGLNITPTA